MAWYVDTGYSRKSSTVYHLNINKMSIGYLVSARYLLQFDAVELIRLLLNAAKLDSNCVPFVHAVYLYYIGVPPVRRKTTAELEHNQVGEDTVVEEPAEAT